MTDHSHPHPFQKDLEDAPFSEKMLLTQSIQELLIEKGITTNSKIRKQIEILDNKTPALGAKLIARAWQDPAFKKRVLSNVNHAALEIGIDTGDIPIRAIENTKSVHNVVVCTLCSCYPRMLLGLPPDWYKSRIYRMRTVKEPRKVLAEFGTLIEKETEINVYDSTADLRYIVLPLQPKNTADWPTERLTEIITRDCMIGVSRVAI